MDLMDALLRSEHRLPENDAILLPLSDPPLTWNFRELLTRIRSVATALANAGLTPGMRVMISVARIEEAVPAILGCLYSRVVASILPLPAPPHDGGSRYSELIRKARASGFHALITGESVPDSPLPVLDAATLLQAPPASIPPARGNPNEPAYIQFSSGASGNKKGVVVSRRAINNMLRDFARVQPLTPHATTASWLPLFHDFGLFAGVLGPLFHGSRALLCTPIQWLRNPARFLEILEEHEVSAWFITPSGLLHTLRCHPPGPRSIRLNALESVILGGEPLHFAVLEYLLDRLTTLGCRENVLRNGYGMAENTLYASITPRGCPIACDRVQSQAMAKNHARPWQEDSGPSMVNISIGTPHGSNEIRIRDDHDRPLGERLIGEIQVRSHTLFSQYHQRPDLEPILTEDGWYRTGDRGYMAADEVYFCGRKRDLIIVGGDNIAPEDIEAVTYGLDGIFPERSAAFGIYDPELGTEHIALMVEGQRGLTMERKEEIIRQLAQRVYRETGHSAREIRVVPRGWICRTQNGKISRSRTRDKFLTTMI